MNRLRMAVVGAGALGRHHARILSGLDRVELVAVADSVPETAQSVAEACGTNWTTSASTLTDRVDAVSIVVPTVAHEQTASLFLCKGCHVFIEKPLTADLDQARRIIDLADKNSSVLQVGHVERFNPVTPIARELCPDPRYIRAERMSPYTFRSTDIGVVHDLMIHDVDLVLDFVQAPLVTVNAFGLSVMGGFEDMVQARLAFQNGCIADLTASRLCPTASRTMQLWSLDNCVAVDFASRHVSSFKRSDKLLHGPPPATDPDLKGQDRVALMKQVFGTYIQEHQPEVPDTDALTEELSAFVSSILSNSPPIVGGEHALAALTAADEILASVQNHAWDGCEGGRTGPFAQPPLRESRPAA